MKDGVVDAIRDAGGEIYAITSEPQAIANRAREDWELSFETVGDPHQEILDACKQRGWLSLFVAEWGAGFIDSEDSWVSHPKGYFQPGVLALRAEGRVLYRWRCRPNRQSVRGGTVVEG